MNKLESSKQRAKSNAKPIPRTMGARMNSALRELRTLLLPREGRDVEDLVEDAVTYIKLLKANAAKGK